MDDKSVGTASIVSGKASAKAGLLAAGTHSVTATYSRDKYHPAAKASEESTVSQ